jgi:hypothetical protein
MYFPVAAGVHRNRLLNNDAKAGFDGCKKSEARIDLTLFVVSESQNPGM